MRRERVRDHASQCDLFGQERDWRQFGFCRTRTEVGTVPVALNLKV